MKPIERIGSNELRDQQLKEAVEYQKQVNKKIADHFKELDKTLLPEKDILENENPNLRLVCFWSKKINDESKLPWPRQDMFMGNNEELEKVATYLDSGKEIAKYMDHAFCKLCGEGLGATDCSDGTYVWPSQCSHYLRAHRIFLPEGFMNHVLGG